MTAPPRRTAAAAALPPLLLALLLAGCGAAGPAGGGASAAREGPGWSVELAALLPAIRACLAADDAAAAVTRAWPMARDLAGVRVRRADGGRSDCVAAADGRRVVLTEPVPASSRRVLEEAPLFTPRGREPPRGPCVATVPAVVGAERVGWLSYAAAACDGGQGGQGGPAPPAGRARPAPARPPLPPV